MPIELCTRCQDVLGISRQHLHVDGDTCSSTKPRQAPGLIDDLNVKTTSFHSSVPPEAIPPQGLRRGEKWLKQKIPHHSIADLERSATAGCLLCKFIALQTRESWKKYIVDRGEELVEMNLSFQEKDPEKLYGMARIEYNLTNEKQIVVMINYFSHGVEDNSFYSTQLEFIPMSGHALSAHQGRPKIVHEYLNGSIPSSPAPGKFDTEQYDRLFPNVSNQVKQWVEDCQERHTACQLRRALFSPSRWDQVALPTRLIEIKTCYGDTDVRLKEGRELPAGTRYMTLSHCWGKTSFLNLKAANLDDFKSSIPFEDLRQTFKDAIRFTFEMGVQYLWIDALCIIQDSEEDWAKEA